MGGGSRGTGRASNLQEERLRHTQEEQKAGGAEARADAASLVVCDVAAQEMAAERGDKGVVGETYKWLGHAHNRLAATQEAQRTFEQGAAYAKQHGLQRLEIDCLGGLGCLYRCAVHRSARAPSRGTRTLHHG